MRRFPTETSWVKEYLIKWYSFIKLLRDNDRHYTYLSRTQDWTEVVVKVSKSQENNELLAREIARNQTEKWVNISWAKILDYEYNYFVSVKYPKTVSTLVDELEKSWNKKWLIRLFRIILNWTEEISEERHDEESVEITVKNLRSREMKYSCPLIEFEMQREVWGILEIEEGRKRNIPRYSIALIANAWLCSEYCRKKITTAYINHACLHLDHLFVGDKNSWKLVAIDWEHSEMQPYRIRFLDEAYIFQNLLHRHREESAILFYKEFLRKYWKNLSEIAIEIRQAFVKKNAMMTIRNVSRYSK